MDLATMLEELDTLVQQAKAMPLSSSVLVNREELVSLVARMRETLPEEVQQARAVVRDRDELLAKARAHAEQLVARGHQEQSRLAEQEEVVQRAHQEAARILSAAQDQSRHLRAEADAYADEKLAALEGALHAALQVVEQTETTLTQGLATAEHGRQRLRTPGLAEPTAPLQAAPFDEEQVPT